MSINLVPTTDILAAVSASAALRSGIGVSVIGNRAVGGPSPVASAVRRGPRANWGDTGPKST
jgi:hypothetical protein